MSSKRIYYWLAGTSIVVVGALAGFLAWEFTTSTLQAKYLTEYAAKMHYQLEPKASRSIYFPKVGPADIRKGYVQLPEISKLLLDQGFEISQQARISPAMQQMAKQGLNLPYHEKDQSGLTVTDASGDVVFESHTPQRVYPDFKSIPPLIRNSLLFVENRELLAADNPKRNPAVEWDRLAQAVLDKLIQFVYPSHDVPGGSTLATQIEKYRHSPDGLTMTVQDKWQQMASASVRAYLDGEKTLPARQRLVLDYLNTVPLSAAPKFGEVIGLPDALWAWYGLDVNRVNQLLLANHADAETGNAYKHVLSLIIAQRKPSYYLNVNHKALEDITNVHLRLLAREGVISPALRDVALQAPLSFNVQRPIQNKAFIAQKAANAVRSRLANLLGVSRLYDLDRYDVSADSTLNSAAQQSVSQFLVSLNSPEGAAKVGMYGRNLLNPDNDLSKIIYSFTLYEMTPQGALLRIQADNLNQPFDINKGAKLDLGSTAKLRTMISYLEIVTALHDQYSKLSAKELAALVPTSTDAISAWAVNYYQHAQDKSLTAMLEAAMDRQYSADTSQPFFTGGGLHRFVNFNKDDNGRIMNLWDATRNSVNLVYIRLMRDISLYYMAQSPGMAGRILEDVNNPERRTYLERFADKEGQAYLLRFYKTYRGQTPAQVTETLLNKVHPTPRRLAAVFRYLAPDESLEDFAKFMRARSVDGERLTDATIASLYKQYAPDAFSLADLGYITQVHPLELWLVSYLRQHPQHSFDQIVAASHDQRIAVYNWLFSTGRKNAQDIRIRSLLEVESFEKIHQDWKRLGYPFDSLVPSYATALGTSADRPAALAELMGILVNKGVRMPAVSIEKVHFAAGTPYETVFVRKPPQGERLLPEELTVVVRKALQGVVERGTAGRLRGVFKDNDGNPLIMGGKTGTGDHRFDTVDANGNVVSSRVVNRTATMVFFIGDKFFGTMTAIVRGEDGAQYHFTSSLPAQLIKAMSPQLSAVLAPSRIVQAQPEVEMDDPAEVVEEPAQSEAIPVPEPVQVPVKVAPIVIAPHLKPATRLEPVVKPVVVSKPIAPPPVNEFVIPQQVPAPIEERRPAGGEAY
ncbi:transglycosylase domain-containing protein [Sulfuriferula nivalis]|uniref:peptidoglycan glycosyltransferase n=1 Tax=Sulfuriferula nivalis TaxID=2675298 RepID=A0A809RR03_9PROT|nr:transglycosylase domain-containing protein [Sulfuriferula nivalis]BBP01291.1 glycosyl transferase family 51 [Sulfuriferula nivalis]